MTIGHQEEPVVVDSALLPGASRAASRSQFVTAVLMRPLMRRLRLTRRGVAFLRVVTDLPTRFARPIPGTSVEVVRAGDIRGEWVRAPGVGDSDEVVLYMHGSAFTILSARSHRALVSRLSESTRLPVFSVDYRLAPEHPFPAAADDVAVAYRHLVGLGYAPGKIVFAGDSAGGHLALGLALTLARSREIPPAGLVLLSPLVDLSLGLATTQEAHRPDPLVTAADCRRLVDLYIAGSDRSDPRITLTLDDVVAFPPTLIQAGGNEMLRADAQHLHHVLSAHGATSYLQIWPGQAHVFQASLRLPESVAALRQAASFVRHVLHISSSAK